ncbi:MAG: CpsB/CapC family capsule biosynthesis tyrosine phosphatase [Pseudomonadota bacterium]
MIDIHCHFLPGIDDGPASMEEAVALARLAVEDGITCSFVTPHIHPGRWENETKTITRQVMLYREQLRLHQVQLDVRFAAEVRLTDFIFKQLELLQLPFLGVLDGFSLMLLEFPHGHLIPGSGQLVEWLVRQKIRPIIAHPERNKAVMRTPAALQPFLQAGCLLQVTAGSLTGLFGEGAQQVALQLLEQDQISFIATDAHNVKRRPPVLSEAFALVSKLKGQARAEQLFEGNQRAFMQPAAESAFHA